MLTRVALVSSAEPSAQISKIALMDADEIEPTGYFASQRLDMLPQVPLASSYLDVGCGEGRFGGHLKERAPSAIVWGIEPTHEAALEANSRLDHVIEGTFPDCIEQIDRRFDCIICNDVLEHMVDPWQAASELASLLMPGGALVVSIPNIRNLGTLSQLVFKGRWDYVSAGVLDRTHLRFFTRATTIEMVESAGLRVDLVQGAWPLVTPKMKLLRAMAWFVSRTLAREGVYRQFVVVARSTVR